MLIPWWLISSYAYYHLNISLITDYAFDFIGATIKKKYNQITHRHKYLVDIRSTQSAFYLAEQHYPMMVKGAATYLIEKAQKGG